MTKSLLDILADVVPANIVGLPVYQPGKPLSEVEREIGITGAIKLASNESVTGPSPHAIAAMRETLEEVHKYPDGGAFHLRQALAKHLEVDGSELIFGAGCNEIIYLAVQTFCRPGRDEVISHDYAFISYKLAALGHGSPFASAPTNEVLGCDVDALLAKASDRTRVVFLANPNNPTGAHLEPAALVRLLRELPEHILLVVDEAYFEYASRAGPAYKSSLELRDERPMLLTLRTFSKIYGLAGLRVGYGIARPELIDILGRARRPFNVNTVAQAAAAAAVADTEHVEKAAKDALAGVARLRTAIADLGVTVYPSLANFVLVDVGRDAAEVFNKMLHRGVVIRPMKPWGLATCVRISTGTPEQNERAIATLAEVLAE